MSSSSPSSATTLLHDRFLGFLIWQSLPSTVIFLFFAVSVAPSFLTFFPFTFSLLLYSLSLSSLSSPRPLPSLSPWQLPLRLLKLLFFSSASDLASLKTSLKFVLFVVASAVSCSIAVLSLCYSEDVLSLGLRGFVVGLLYGIHYVFRRRWVLEFPIIQRPVFFSFKMGLPSATTQALKLSCVAFLLSSVVPLFMPDLFTSRSTVGRFIRGQIKFYITCFGVFLCWELSHHLHQVLNTKRVKFAPPKGSAAAETNPSEPLLATLEESTPRCLLQYLAYLDLCMVCESNVDSWRRAAFFEETGETYKRVFTLSLRPLKEFASKLGEGLESSSADRSDQLSRQLRSATATEPSSRIFECFDDFQLYVWCARSVASLTACSRKEDRFGVAQLSGSNAAAISALISCLLAVETFMGKKTNLQSTSYAMGAAGIKWATVNTGRGMTTGVSKPRSGHMYSKAYAMADVLRTSIYSIVSAFHDEMSSGLKSGNLDKDWIGSSKPPYGSRDLISQKLRLFLDFRAC